jgi:hypothetical protein
MDALLDRRATPGSSPAWPTPPRGDISGTPTVPGYLTTSSASSTYAPLASPVLTGSPIVLGYQKVQAIGTTALATSSIASGFCRSSMDAHFESNLSGIHGIRLFRVSPKLANILV